MSVSANNTVISEFAVGKYPKSMEVSPQNLISILDFEKLFF
ncbi:hypothetical protein OMAG_000963 [Candidatus Omnitrophus magneticus]|uniref:Uncharacterized protein n=1 Tax=Candidatus Omnitrophus magneticus TaxID=1609969 RepID=A0A0F0CPJ9_9BACT|nr:hypothetical protein OMAG_000963 [Candidatus Omnitrophus magneticus]